MNKLLLVAFIGLIATGAYAACDNPAAGQYDNAGTCANCNAACTECDGGLATDCTACAAGKFVSDAGSCDTCPTGCATCNKDDCLTCSAGYGLSGTGDITCATCTVKNCATCPSAPGTCTGCSDGYYLKAASGSTAASCVACTDANCAVCSDDKTCSECKDGYAFDDDEACTACTNGCKTCDDIDDWCDSCPSTSVINSTNKDEQFCCFTNCSTCSGPASTNCITCRDGLKLDADKKTCFGFKTGASLTLGAIISVALFSLLF